MEQEMQENNKLEPEQVSEEPYVDRPRWQVIGARIALVIFLISVALYYYYVAGGGL